MTKRQRTRFHPHSVTTTARFQRTELVVDVTTVGVVAGAVGHAQQLAIHVMLARPSAAHLWTVILIAVAGALVCRARGNATRHPSNGR
jgi:hypothetical protein